MRQPRTDAGKAPTDVDGPSTWLRARQPAVRDRLALCPQAHLRRCAAWALLGGLPLGVGALAPVARHGLRRDADDVLVGSGPWFRSVARLRTGLGRTCLGAPWWRRAIPFTSVARPATGSPLGAGSTARAQADPNRKDQNDDFGTPTRNASTPPADGRTTEPSLTPDR